MNGKGDGSCQPPCITSSALSRSFPYTSKQTSSAMSVRLTKIVIGRSASFAVLRIPLRVSTKARLLRILRCGYCHQPCIRSSTTNHDSFSELPLYKGGRALNQEGDRLSPTTGVAGLPCMRADGTGCSASRSFQYSRTANFRAMATFATLPPRRNFNR